MLFSCFKRCFCVSNAVFVFQTLFLCFKRCFRVSNRKTVFQTRKQRFKPKNSVSNLKTAFQILRARWFCDTMGERMGRIGRIRTDFFLVIPQESSYCALSFRRNLRTAPCHSVGIFRTAPCHFVGILAVKGSYGMTKTND
jgi:hypothetical protein